jgi:hypothetical protein
MPRRRREDVTDEREKNDRQDKIEESLETRGREGEGTCDEVKHFLAVLRMFRRKGDLKRHYHQKVH